MTETADLLSAIKALLEGRLSLRTVAKASNSEVDLAISVAQQAFGGMNQSGYGCEMGKDAIVLYSQTKRFRVA
ncbi:MAG: hypothetical protein GY789_02625 [Hyphomicrobiales bacterium]|nr:hypothetical protein [Hyphomicrobiales bacterium]